MAQTHDYSDDELDAFDARNEQVLLDQAGQYMHGRGSSDDESDEEVLGLKNGNDSEDENNSSENSENEENSENDEDSAQESGTEGWGSKKDYYGGDDVSDDEDGDAMAEEALRQQKKHAQDLAMDDFVDEATMQDWQKSAVQFDNGESQAGAVVEEKDVDFAALDDDEKLKHLNGSFPEFVPLLAEYESLNGRLPEVREAQNGGRVARVKYVALSAYLGAISAYFALFCDKMRAKHTFSMKEEPVMETILSTREVWRQASELRDLAPSSASAASEDEMDATDIADLAANEYDHEEEHLATDSEEDSDSDSESDAEKHAKTPVDIDYEAKRTIRAPKVPSSSYAGDYTESTAMDSVDLEEKQRRKKSLRFYTSKIDQAAQKQARRERFDGDADLPYRERLFERQQRLVEEARRKGLGQDRAQLGEDLDGADYASADEDSARKINQDAGEYYDSIREGKSAAKAARKDAHEQAKRAARAGQLAELAEHVDEHGKRALNFQILKNKGLTPHRRNENRNARVKKRKRYDQAQKKLRSVRQVHTEGGQGPYQGEKTGIKKGLSRSVRLQ